jgi:N-acylneuraminate cytidylyltransferase
MDILIFQKADSVLPVVKFSSPPLRGLVIDGDKLRMKFPENCNVRSQDLAPIYYDAGQFYCMKISALLREVQMFCENTLPIELSEMEAQDIDNIDDWKLAELKYRMLHRV